MGAVSPVVIQYLAQIVNSGLALGSVYGLMAIGFALIFNSSRLINFAQGELLLIGGLTLQSLTQAMLLPPVAALAAAALFGFILGHALYASTLGVSINASPLRQLMLTVAASLCWQGVAIVIWGKNPIMLPQLLPLPPLRLGLLFFSQDTLTALALASASVVLLSRFLFRTRVGRAVGAVCMDPRAPRGPARMTTLRVSGGGGRSGYWLIAGLQLSMGLVFLLSMRFWGGASPSGGSCMESREEEKCHVTGDISAWCSVVFFFCYCGVEYGFGLWGVTFLINCRGFELEAAGYALALYWGALSCGRFISGVIADGVGNRRMIWAGIVLTLAGQLLLLLPFASWMWGAVVLMGLGLSPIYPCMMHETPRRFSARRANVVMGFQSGSAALGIAVLPFLTGYLGGSVGFRILPFVLTGILLLLPLSFTLLNRRADRGGSGV